MHPFNACKGTLKYEVVAGRTAMTHGYASYPLKFLHPRRTIRQGFDTFVTYLLGYGGGMVSTDFVEVSCTIMSSATIVLCTQASTKIFKAESSDDYITQSFTFEVDCGATLALLPDPVTCYKKARYRQNQIFHMASDANIVFVDWLTSGRKKNFLTMGSLQNDRQETHEHWSFDAYENSLKIFMEGELLLSDAIRLFDDHNTPLRQRMHDTNVLGLLVIVGERFRVITRRLMELSQRKHLQAQDLTPHGRLTSQSDFAGIIASARSLGTNGVLVRFCADDTEHAMTYVKDVLSPLKDLMGFTPYQTNR